MGKVLESRKKYYKDHVGKRLEECVQQVAKYRKALRFIEKEKTEPLYAIELRSYWKNEGEKDVHLESTGPLRQLIRDAEKQFMEINRRSDVQARYLVCLSVCGLTSVLPENLWEKYKMKRK